MIFQFIDFISPASDGILLIYNENDGSLKSSSKAKHSIFVLSSFTSLIFLYGFTIILSIILLESWATVIVTFSSFSSSNSSA